MFSGNHIGVADEGRADEEPRQNTRHEHLRHGDVHDQAVEDHGDGRGNDDSQGTGYGNQSQAEPFPVARLDERGNHDGADGHHRCRGGTGNGGEEDAGQDPGNGQASRKPSHQGVDEIDEAPGDGALGHDGTGHDEKRDGQKNEFVQGVEELLGQDVKGGVGKKKKGDRGGNPQDHRDGDAGQEQETETEADGEGHEATPSVSPLESSGPSSLRKLIPTVQKTGNPMTMEKMGMGR